MDSDLVNRLLPCLISSKHLSQQFESKIGVSSQFSLSQTLLVQSPKIVHQVKFLLRRYKNRLKISIRSLLSLRIQQVSFQMVGFIFRYSSNFKKFKRAELYTLYYVVIIRVGCCSHVLGVLLNKLQVDVYWSKRNFSLPKSKFISLQCIFRI